MFRTILVKQAVGFIEKRLFSCHEFRNFGKSIAEEAGFL